MNTADAIVCLGVRTTSEAGRRAMRARVAKAVDLWRAGTAPRLILSGGRTGRGESEARHMAALAGEVPPAAIILEESSTTTVGNAYGCRDIVRQHGWSSLIIVTSPYHVRRARHVFARVMPEVRCRVVASAQHHSLWRRAYLSWKEYLFFRDIVRRGVENARR